MPPPPLRRSNSARPRRAAAASGRASSGGTVTALRSSSMSASRPSHNGRMGWQERAACAGSDTAIFFEYRHEPAALAMCGRCPVRAECLAAALAEETDAATGNPLGRQMRHGVRGGLTGTARFAVALPERHAAYVSGYRRGHAVPA